MKIIILNTEQSHMFKWRQAYISPFMFKKNDPELAMKDMKGLRTCYLAAISKLLNVQLR